MNMEEKILQVPVEDIIPNRFQPRENFDETSLNELANSIKQHGIIQPLVLRKLGDKFEIVAGERRYKAAQIAGLTAVPAVISNIDDSKSAEVALIENIQRKNLTSIEEAKSYKNILDRGMTQEQLAEKLGISQSTVANKLRLLNLDEEVQEALLKERISERHARALLTLPNKSDQVKWLNKIINDRLTVRQLDIELKKGKNSNETEEDSIPLVNNLTPDIEDIKNNALDINPVQGLHDIQKMLEPSMPGEKDYSTLSQNIDTLDLDEDDSSSSGVTEDKPQNKFFNFLEDEVANMNESNSIDDIFNRPMPSINTQQVNPIDEVIQNQTESVIEEAENNNIISDSNEIIENEDNLPVIDIPVVQEKNDEQFLAQSVVDTTLNDSNNETEIVNPFLNPINEDNNDIVELNDAPIENNTIEISSENIPAVDINQFQNNSENENTGFFNFGSNSFENELLSNSNVIEDVQEVKVNNDFDPMSMINTLEPDYEQKIKEDTGTDLKSAINILRSTKEELEAKGFIVNLDEADLGTSYSITFTIMEDNINE